VDDLTSLVWRKSSYSAGTGGDCVEVAETWRKSSRSGGQGGECVEVTDLWRKSSHSGGTGGECVEVADGLRGVAMRDSKHPDGAVLVVSRAAWRSFSEGVKAR